MALRDQKKIEKTDFLVILHLSHNMLSWNIADGFRLCGCHGELSVNLYYNVRAASLRQGSAKNGCFRFSAGFR